MEVHDESRHLTDFERSHPARSTRSLSFIRKIIEEMVVDATTSENRNSATEITGEESSPNQAYGQDYKQCKTKQSPPSAEGNQGQEQPLTWNEENMLAVNRERRINRCHPALSVPYNNYRWY